MAKKTEQQKPQKEKLAAEIFAQNQREISVSEFFLKNRHLLGFDNPRKALLTTVKEGVDNSVIWDTPIIVKQKGLVSVKTIGSLLDEYFTTRDKVIKERDGSLEKRRDINGIEVLAFDKLSYKVAFKKVETIFRHKVNSPIYRVRLENGRYIDLTAYHSLFTFKQGSIVPIATSDIVEGDYVVVPRKVWAGVDNYEVFDLIEVMSLLEEQTTEKIKVYGINHFLSRITPQLKVILPKNRRYRIGDFRKLNAIPFNILRRIKINPAELDKCKIGVSNCQNKIPVRLVVDGDFMKLLGLYAAEGSTISKLFKVCFSFGAHEKRLIRYTADLGEKVFGFKPKLIKAHKSAINVTYDCKIMGILFKDILEMGKNAKNKRVPTLVFNVPNILKEKFLLGYLAGDGYPSEIALHALENNIRFRDISSQKVVLASASKQLVTDLEYLLSYLGLAFHYREVEAKRREINGVHANFSNSFRLEIYTSQLKGNINRLLISSFITTISDSKLKYAVNECSQTQIGISNLASLANSKQIMLYEGSVPFIEGDLGLLKVKSIEEIDYDKEWVYDVSVPDCENFVAGYGAIACHNSMDATEEMKVLPEIFVDIEPIKGEIDRFRITVEDNGPGIVKAQIPRIFGKLLYGSKFHKMKQSRGQQGIGISAAALYGQLTTGQPIKILSKIGANKPAHYIELHIDTKRNEPVVLKEEEREWEKEHGTKIILEIEAKYLKGKQSVDDYLKATAIANPHARISYKTPEGEKIEFPRATNSLPVEPKEIKPHPYGIEVGMLIKMLRETKARTISSFLQTEFSRVSPAVAKQICEKAKIEGNAKPSRIAREEADNLMKAIRATKIMAPPTNCLAPIGEETMIKGLKKEIDAEFFFAKTRPPAVYRGNPFQIEVSCAYGGSLPVDDFVRVLRFANRVPLLYQQSSCATFRAIFSTAWRNYGLSQNKGSLPIGPLALMIHMSSVWVPFTSESKEAIANYPEIIKEIRLALQECGRQLGSHIRKIKKREYETQRKHIFEKYMEEVITALKGIAKFDEEKLRKDMLKIAHKRTVGGEDEEANKQ